MKEYEKLSEEEERVGAAVVDAAIAVHRALGPGLLERPYELCLCHALTRRGLKWRRQVKLPIVYDGLVIEDAYEIDILVEELVVAEIKSVSDIADVHVAQCLTHLKFAKKRLGYVLNFNVTLMKRGIKRVVL
jgi:GxxExxY protein